MWMPIRRSQTAFIHLFIFLLLNLSSYGSGWGLKRRFNTDEKLMEEDGSLRFTGSCEEALLPGGRPVQVGNNAWVFFVLFFILLHQRKSTRGPRSPFRVRRRGLDGRRACGGRIGVSLHALCLLCGYFQLTAIFEGETRFTWEKKHLIYYTYTYLIFQSVTKKRKKW